MPDVDAHARSRRRLVRALIIAAALIVVMNLTIVAVSQTRTGSRSQTNVLPAEVSGISPVPGSTVRPQDTVSIDLRDDLTGDLRIDGTDIPVDQTGIVAGLGMISFRPGPGKEFTEFGPGQHTVEVRWRPQNAPADAVTGTYSWSFGVA